MSLKTAGVLTSSVFFLFCLIPIGVINASTITINEVAWMGTENSHTDEWIELYNNTASPASLEGWILTAADEIPKISLEGMIPGQGFYLLERTDDSAAPNIDADQIYAGALNNNGETLKLYNNLGDLIDSVVCEDGWPAGDNTTKQTMERKDSKDWQTSQNPGGTPKTQNSPGSQKKPIQEESTARPEEMAKIVYPSNVIINEILPSPAGPDSEEEWIEIFNKNNFEISLFEWQITDVKGKTNSYTFPKGTTMNPKSFLVLYRPTSKITMNNSGDSLKLVQPDGNVVDVVNCGKARQEESYNRIGSEWVWSNTLTPGYSNITPAPVLETKDEEESLEDEPSSIGVASVGEQVPRTSPIVSFILLIAVPIAVLSGIIILTLKKKLKIGYNQKT